MAFPSIAALATTPRGSDETSSPVNLPAGIVSSDLLLVAIRVCGAGAIGWPSGWTELLEDSSDSSDDVVAIAWRRADGTEGATIDVSHGSAKSCAIAWRIVNAGDPAVQPPEASAVAIGSSSSPDPASLTPTGGAKDYLWLGIASHAGYGTVLAYPSDLPTGQTQVGTGGASPESSNARIYTGATTSNAASFNPASFLISASKPWAAWTIAVHPAALIAPAAGLGLDAPTAGLVMMRQILAASPAELALDAPRPLFAGGARISEGQAALAGGAALAPVLLVHLTTYSDALLGTVEAEYWWTHGEDVLYPWGGAAARTFESAILSAGSITRKIEHLPAADLADLRRTLLELVVANEELPGDTSRWAELRTRRLLYSRVELAVLLIPPRRRTAGGTAAWDLRDLGGAEHVVWFRGECTHVGPVTETTIPMTFEALEPSLDWPRSTVASECDPRHLGARYPVPIGKAKAVPCVNRKVGWYTTLADGIDTTTTTGNVAVTDATGFPDAGSFTLQIGSERVTASKVNPTTINVSARAQAGTKAVIHKTSEQAIEILSSAVLVFSGVPAKALDALYVISPLTGQKVRITTPFSVALADAATDAGRTLGTVTFASSQFQAMIDEMVAVSQQPGLESGGVFDSIPFTTFAIASPNPAIAVNYNGFPQLTNASTLTSPTRLYMAPTTGTDGGASDEYWKVYWTSSSGMPNPTAAVTQFRVRLTLSGLGGPGGFPNTQGLRVRGEYVNIYGFTGSFTAYTFDNGSQENNVTFVGAWHSGGGRLENTLVDSSGNSKFIRFWIEPITTPSGGFYDSSHNFAELEFDNCELEVELSPSSLTDVGIAAISLGWGLDFVADVQGAMLGTGVLAENPADVLEWFLATFAGLGANAVERTSFAQAKSDLGADVLAGDLRLAGESFAEVVALLGFHSRANLVAREGPLYTTYRLLCAKGDNSFPASGGSLAEFRDQTETRREANEQATRFLAHYHLEALDPRAATLGAANAVEVVRIDKAQNDATAKVATAALTAAEQRYGRRDGAAVLFSLIVDRPTAIDVLGYYAFEAIADRGRFAGVVPFGDGYLLELGDVRTFTPRGWASSVKGRVVQITLAPTEPGIGLVLEEVT